MWEHLSRAGFINGAYTYSAPESASTGPSNRYGVESTDHVRQRLWHRPTLRLSHLRHNIKTGSQVPVEILAEIDRKIDDGAPNTGGFQFSIVSGQLALQTLPWPVPTPALLVPGATATWAVHRAASTNCGGASLL